MRPITRPLATALHPCSTPSQEDPWRARELIPTD